MRPKTLLILAVVVLLLGAFIWFYERDLPGSEERAEQAKRVLGGLESRDVEAMEIAWEDQRVRLERRAPEEAEVGEDADQDASAAEESWRLVEPWATRADPTEVSRLLDTLTDLEKRRTLEDPDRGAMGLDPPAATVTLTTEEGGRVLQVGGEVPVSKDRIVALADGAEAYQVRGAVWDDLTRDPGEWRDRKILAADTDDVKRVELSAEEGEEPVVLVRDGDSFRLEAPLEDRADRDAVRTFFDRLTGLRAQSFVDDPQEVEAEDPGALGLDPPQAVVTVHPEGDDPVRVELGGVADEELDRRYGRVGDQVFVFTNRDLVEDLGRTAADWRSPTWSGLRVFRIDAVEVKDEGGTLKVERSGSDWVRGEDRIAYGPVSDLLYAVTEAEAERLLSPDEAKAEGWSLDTPTHTVRLWVEDAAEGDDAVDGEGAEDGAGEAGAAPTEVLTLYPPVEAGVPGRADDRDVVLLLPAERLTTLEEAVAGVRDAEPIPEEGEDEPGEEEGNSDELEPLEITTEEGD